MPEKLKHTVLRIFMETQTFLTPPFWWFHTYLSKFPKFQPRLELSNIFPNIHRSVVNIFNGTNFPRAIPRAKRLSIAGSDAAEVGKKAATRAAGNAGGRRVPIDAAGTGMRSQGRNFMFAVFFSPGWVENEEVAWSGSRVTVLRPRLVYDCFTACERLARATSPITVKSCRHRLRWPLNLPAGRDISSFIRTTLFERPRETFMGHRATISPLD